MELEFALKITVSNQVDLIDGIELFDYFKSGSEDIVLSLKQSRDRVFFTNHKIVIIDFTGLTEKKKQIYCIPYRNLNGYLLDTSGSFSKTSELILFIKGIGNIQISMGGAIQTKQVAQIMSGMIN